MFRHGRPSRDILRVLYDGAGRVKESLSGRKYSFGYVQGKTIVIEGTGHSHVFGHNAAGITNWFDSTNGVWWQLELDGQNRVVEAHSDNGAYQYTYEQHGRITRAIEQLPRSTSAREYQYDAQGRVTGIYLADGGFTSVDYSGGQTRISGQDIDTSFEVLPSGRIGSVRAPGLSVDADYDTGGNLISFRSNENAVAFGRDALGRVSEVQFANGQVNRYAYDELGNRASMRLGSGGAVDYTHDPSGNIVEVVVTEQDNEQKRQVVQIGDMNRVESITYEGAGKLDINYDGMGRAVSFTMGDEVVSVEYEGPDRIARIVSQATGAVWTPDEEVGREENAQSALDTRLEVVLGDSAVLSHPDYGIMGFGETSLSLVARDPMESGVPGLRAARQLLATAEPLLSADRHAGMMDFEKPSNPVFQPLEYRSTNCCILIPTHLRAVVPDGRPFSDGTPSFCFPYSFPGFPRPPPWEEYEGPPDTTLPSARLVPWLDDPPAAGVTRIRGVRLEANCKAYTKEDETVVWRFEGDINQDEFSISVGENVPPYGTCGASPRTPTEILTEAAHERRHAEAYAGIINEYKGMIGIEEFTERGTCKTGIGALNGKLQKALEKMRCRQESHADFAGETKYKIQCRPPSDAELVESGTYPNPLPPGCEEHENEEC